MSFCPFNHLHILFNLSNTVAQSAGLCLNSMLSCLAMGDTCESCISVIDPYVTQSLKNLIINLLKAFTLFATLNYIVHHKFLTS